MNNTIIVWDTETTGLPLFKEPSEDPRQPHIVQLAACLVDLDKRETISTIDLIAKPEGWIIPDEVAKIHGITTEYASAIGVPEKDIVAMFLALGVGRTHVAHNSTFDERIVRIALKRMFTEADAEAFKARSFNCTQILSTPILKLPPTAKMIAANRNHHKSASLAEAYQFFTGMPLEGAHRAIVDVHACIAIYYAIQDLRLKNAA